MKLLALVPEAASVTACLDTAAAAAEGLPDVSVGLLHVVVDPAVMVAAAEMIDMEYLRIRREGTAEERAEAARQAFDAWTAAHPDALVAPRWTQTAGTEIETICEVAKGYDLLVVPRGLNEDGGAAMYAAFYRAGRPFILAPHEGLLPKGRRLSDRIVIAWNNTPACRRATEAARPWLKLCNETAIMLIGAEDSSAEEYSAELRDQGIPIAPRRIARDREALGDQIVTEAEVLGASLLVMGAHRHAAWLEWLLGHTTDQALRHADMTFLMAH